MLRQYPKLYICGQGDVPVRLGLSKGQARREAKRRGYDPATCQKTAVWLDWERSRLGCVNIRVVAGCRVARLKSESTGYGDTCGKCSCARMCAEIAKVFGRCGKRPRHFVILGVEPALPQQ